MTHRQIHGLWFKVFSPSHYELCARDDDSFISIVAVVLCGRVWYIDVLMKAGHSVHRGPFKSRDAAVAMIAGRQELSA